MPKIVILKGMPLSLINHDWNAFISTGSKLVTAVNFIHP